jgi:hypothetical protein
VEVAVDSRHCSLERRRLLTVVARAAARGARLHRDICLMLPPIPPIPPGRYYCILHLRLCIPLDVFAFSCNVDRGVEAGSAGVGK